ncbi:MAG: NFACT family protein [Candidatus Woesearchaeota archaeon]|nr:MAG: NFACT family protein [Candidatus Woesearchaeota archaeon]
MEKKVLTSLELYAVVQELKFLKGALVDKIYQLSSRELLIYLYKAGIGKKAIRIDSGHGIFLTDYQLKKPPYPTSFCMFLRKHLNRAELININQKELERIIEIQFKTKDTELILILELFSKGNFILTDSKYKIINVANVQRWKTRTVKKGEIYKYPPKSAMDLFELDYKTFVNLFDSDKELVKFLAVDLGLGGVYAEEVCFLAKEDKDIVVNKLEPTDAKKVFSALSEIIGKLENRDLSPGIVREDSEIIDAIPFEMNKYPSYERTRSWNEALDFYFTGITKTKIIEKKEEKFNEEITKLNTVLEKQREALEEYREKSEKYSGIANRLYSAYDIISEIISKIKEAKESGYTLDQLREALEEERESGVYEASLVKQIDEDRIILDLGEDVEFLLNESIEKTAESFYEKSKEYKSKIPGAEGIIEETLRKIESLKSKESKIEKEIEQEIPVLKEEKSKEKWFEKFHWFYTSNNKLAIGGRDATQNDILLKKYIEPRDFIFHTEMAGSPFFVLKSGADADERELEEVAIATVSYSRAWREGLSSTDAYYIRPEQVSKTAPSGEYIGKGAWMIRGKKNIFKDVKLELAIGVTRENQVIGSPVSATAKKTIKYVIVKPGWNKKSETAKKIIEKLGIDRNNIDIIMKFLPAGDSTITSVFS